MRLGFFVGFLIGAAIASVLSRTERAEAPSDSTTLPGQAATEQVEGLVARLKRQSREAREAARQAAAETEAELLREWERSRHHGAEESGSS